MAMTVSDLGDQLARHGIEVRDVSVDPGPRVVVGGRGTDAELLLEVTVYCRNAAGNRFFDMETKHAAFEVRQVPLSSVQLS